MTHGLRDAWFQMIEGFRRRLASTFGDLEREGLADNLHQRDVGRLLRSEPPEVQAHSKFFSQIFLLTPFCLRS